MAIKLRFNKEPLMENFVYHHPGSVKDALANAAGEARFLAGGQSLLPSMKLGLAAPDALIDLNGLSELRSIKLEGDELVLGSMATHASVAASDVVKKAIPGLADLAGRIGDRQVLPTTTRLRAIRRRCLVLEVPWSPTGAALMATASSRGFTKPR
jgi:xanthine dehydrogenase iron-sulfur cluster and FAD-binding subunit A